MAIYIHLLAHNINSTYIFQFLSCDPKAKTNSLNIEGNYFFLLGDLYAV